MRAFSPGIAKGAAIGVLVLISAVPLAAAPPPLPTMEDISALVDGGKYRDALSAIARVRDLRGDLAKPYDQHKLMMLRAEAQLQMKNREGALASLALAKKEAKTPEQAADTLALQLLIQRSRNFIYTPSAASGKGPVNILDRSTRKDAYAALAADELTRLERQVDAVKNATSLPPIANVAKNAAPVRAVELAATGKTEQTDAATAQLAALSLKLMNGALAKLQTQVEEIAAVARRPITQSVAVNVGNGQSVIGPVVMATGLNMQQQQTLQNIEKQCDQFPPAAKELAAAFGQQKSFDGVTAKATAIKTQADALLNTDWSDNTNISGTPHQVPAPMPVPPVRRGY